MRRLELLRPRYSELRPGSAGQPDTPRGVRQSGMPSHYRVIAPMVTMRSIPAMCQAGREAITVLATGTRVQTLLKWLLQNSLGPSYLDRSTG